MRESDKIFLSGMTFFGYHGVDSAERSLGQRFVVDVTLTQDLRAAGATDDIANTTNYAAVYRLVRAIVTGPPCNLIEHLAEKVAAAILLETLAQSVTVRVRKPWAPIKESVVESVGVEITRYRAT
jgi:dihydroneopterin aldolase